MEVMTSTQNEIDTQPPNGTGRETNRRSFHISGLLPYVGVMLFLLATAQQFVSAPGDHWGRTLVANSVTYLVGYAMVGAGISRIFFGKRTSKTIGFQQSPYELEVGFADLAMGVVALMAVNYTPEFSLSIILVSSIFRVGCGIGHIRSMFKGRNFAVNNTLILGVNFIVPAFLLVAYFAWA
jgi:hypothetical protein